MLAVEKPLMIDQTQTTVNLFQLLQRNYSYCQERWQRYRIPCLQLKKKFDEPADRWSTTALCFGF